MASSTARALLTPSERDLVAASRSAGLKQLSEKRLRTHVVRARNLRDKYRDLARRQRLAARGKPPRGRGTTRPTQGNARTVQKAEIFAKVLDRFQQRLDGLGSQNARPRRGGSTRASAPARAAARRRDTRSSRRKVGQGVRAATRERRRA